MRSRSSSRFGVLPVTIYTKPAACGGSCAFCPQFKGLPRSYTPNEDTALAQSVMFDAGRQFQTRFEMLAMANDTHGVWPFEVIVLGGSFSALDRDYRVQFVDSLLKAMSEIGAGGSETNKRLSVVSASLSILSVESRPDQIDVNELKFLRSLGVSKVELGVQHFDVKVLERSARGHDIECVARASRLLREHGFKVGYHIMLGLPGASPDSDIKMITESLWREPFHPDYLKVYPCELMRDARAQPELWKMHRSGDWQPPSKEHIRDCIHALSMTTPSYVRISRIQRQFDRGETHFPQPPVSRVVANAGFADLRHREIGAATPEVRARVDVTRTLVRETRVGTSIHFEIVDHEFNRTLALARIAEVDAKIWVLREIRVFGLAALIGSASEVQGRGLGTKLLRYVEHRAADSGAIKLQVNAAPGARPFFTKLGYCFSTDFFLERTLRETFDSAATFHETFELTMTA